MNKLFLKSLLLSVGVLIVFSGATYAANPRLSVNEGQNPGGVTEGNQPGGLTNPIPGVNNIGELVTRVIRWMLSMVGVLALLALVWGSILYVTAFVDEGQTQKAKKIIVWAIIGIIVAGSSYAILSLVISKILGVTF